MMSPAVVARSIGQRLSQLSQLSHHHPGLVVRHPVLVAQLRSLEPARPGRERPGHRRNDGRQRLNLPWECSRLGAEPGSRPSARRAAAAAGRSHPSAGRLPTLPKPADGGGRFRPTLGGCPSWIQSIVLAPSSSGQWAPAPLAANSLRSASGSSTLAFAAFSLW